jgi:hypothetical protein
MECSRFRDYPGQSRIIPECPGQLRTCAGQRMLNERSTDVNDRSTDVRILVSSFGKHGSA